MAPASAPYRYEGQAWRAGLVRVAGVDEAGRGPLAGPVVAAAVVVTPEHRIRGVRDSKLLTPERREELFVVIHERALAVGVAIVDHATIDRVNILQATRLAMLDALARLPIPPDFVITDFVTLPNVPCPQKNLVDGDARCASVAAASIVAKVTRDRIMLELDKQFPEYGFARHKGYATPDHLAALDRYGACPVHRRTFAGVWRQGELFVLEGEDQSRWRSVASLGPVYSRYALLFRDYLRSSENVRAEYELLKRRASQLAPDSIDGYLFLEDPVLHIICDAASLWAEKVSWSPDEDHV